MRYLYLIDMYRNKVTVFIVSPVISIVRAYKELCHIEKNVNTTNDSAKCHTCRVRRVMLIHSYAFKQVLHCTYIVRF